MDIKITNCTVVTGGGENPVRLRKSQNVRKSLGKRFENFSTEDLLEFFKYNDLSSCLTSQSKIIYEK